MAPYIVIALAADMVSTTFNMIFKTICINILVRFHKLIFENLNGFAVILTASSHHINGFLTIKVVRKSI